MALEHPKQKFNALQYISLSLAIFALIVAIASHLRQDRVTSQLVAEEENTFERAKRTKTLRVGYGPFPPYTIIDPNFSDPQKALSGFCIDMVNHIAEQQEPSWKVDWIRVSWETLRADIYSGKIDFVANAIYKTVPRASEFSYTEPFTYIGVGVALVRKGDNRFNKFEDLNDPSVTISLAEGWVITGYARQRLPKANLLIKPISGETNILFQDLIADRADVVLTDSPVAGGIYKEHSEAIDVLWLENPPIIVEACFSTRKGESGLIEFLNTSISTMEADGTLDVIDKKWQDPGRYLKNEFRVGTGLRDLIK